MRFLVAALLVANLLFYAWSQGWLDAAVGMRAQGEREPERLARQVRPELIRTLPPAAAASAADAAASGPAGPTACLQAGPFAPAEIAAAEAALPAAAAGRVASQRSERPGSWLVYMGRFAGAEGVRQKEEELGRIHVSYEELTEPPELAPGLVLGRYASRAEAEAALERLAQRGVRTGRVTPLAAPGAVHTLRVEQADAALQAQLMALAAPPFAAHRFAPCPPAAAASAASGSR